MAKINKEEIAVNLLTSNTLQECAERSGIGITTLYRLRKNVAFQELVQTMKREMFKNTMDKAQASSLKALSTLEEIMEDKNATDSSRVASARTILELGLESASQEQILEKLSELERRYKEIE